MMAGSRLEANEWVDAEVRLIDPRGSGLASDALDAALQDVGNEILRSAPMQPARRWALRTPRRLVSVAVLVLGISGAAAWASGMFVNANTHTYNHGWQHVAGGPGENITGAGTNFARVVRAESMGSGIVFPADYANWRTYEIAFIRKQLCAVGHANGGHTCAQESTGMLNVTLAQDAFCTWVLQWRRAELSGNRAAARQAARIIAKVPTWKAATDIKYIQGEFSQDFAWTQPYIDAVAANNVRKVNRMLANQGTGTDNSGGGWFWFFDPGFQRVLERHFPRPITKRRAAALNRAQGPLYLRYLDQHGS
jgi:hypothetical protein